MPCGHARFCEACALRVSDLAAGLRYGHIFIDDCGQISHNSYILAFNFSSVISLSIINNVCIALYVPVCIWLYKNRISV